MLDRKERAHKREFSKLAHHGLQGRISRLEILGFVLERRKQSIGLLEQPVARLRSIERCIRIDGQHDRFQVRKRSDYGFKCLARLGTRGDSLARTAPGTVKLGRTRRHVRFANEGCIDNILKDIEGDKPLIATQVSNRLHRKRKQ